MPAAAEVWPEADPQLLDAAQARRLWTERLPYQRYLLKLLQDNPDPAAAVQALLDPQAPAAAISYVHKLRGSAGSLALPALVAASAALEERLGAAPAQAEAAIAALDTAMRATATAIRGFVAEADAETAAASPSAPDPDDGGAAAAPLSQQWQPLLDALDSDDPDRVERALHGLSPSLPAPMAAELRQLVESFSFREAEAKVRRWQADASP